MHSIISYCRYLQKKNEVNTALYCHYLQEHIGSQSEEHFPYINVPPLSTAHSLSRDKILGEDTQVGHIYLTYEVYVIPFLYKLYYMRN